MIVHQPVADCLPPQNALCHRGARQRCHRQLTRLLLVRRSAVIRRSAVLGCWLRILLVGLLPWGIVLLLSLLPWGVVLLLSRLPRRIVLLVRLAWGGRAIGLVGWLLRNWGGRRGWHRLLCCICLGLHITASA